MNVHCSDAVCHLVCTVSGDVKGSLEKRTKKSNNSVHLSCLIVLSLIVNTW